MFSSRTHPDGFQGALPHVYNPPEPPILIEDPLFTALFLFREMIIHTVHVFPVKSQLHELISVGKEFHM